MRFLSTFLSRENQHELCVSARKFRNLMPFGCWWLLNNPSIIREMTTERIELLGTSFIPQHSDARVLEQLVYKWKHSRRSSPTRSPHHTSACLRAAALVTRAEVERDAARLFDRNFREWVGRPKPGRGANDEKVLLRRHSSNRLFAAPSQARQADTPDWENPRVFNPQQGARAPTFVPYPDEAAARRGVLAFAPARRPPPARRS